MPALRLNDEVLSWSELCTRVDHLASGFAAQGVEEGDGVLLRAWNHPRALLAWLALLQCGARVLPVNPQLPQSLLDALVPDLTLRFALDLDIATEEDGLAINAAGDTTRFNMTGRVAYALRDTSVGTVVTSGTVENFTAYSAIGTTVATLAAERDAVERLMVILGDQITARLFALDLPA